MVSRIDGGGRGPARWAAFVLALGLCLAPAAPGTWAQRYKDNHDFKDAYGVTAVNVDEWLTATDQLISHYKDLNADLSRQRVCYTPEEYQQLEARSDQLRALYETLPSEYQTLIAAKDRKGSPYLTGAQASGVTGTEKALLAQENQKYFALENFRKRYHECVNGPEGRSMTIGPRTAPAGPSSAVGPKGALLKETPPSYANGPRLPAVAPQPAKPSLSCPYGQTPTMIGGIPTCTSEPSKPQTACPYGEKLVVIGGHETCVRD